MLPREKWPSPAVTRAWASGQWHPMHVTEDDTAGQGTDWLGSEAKGRCAGTHPWAQSPCPASLPAGWVQPATCTPESRARRSALAGLPGPCQAARLSRQGREQMSRSWDISALQWTVGQQPQSSRSSHSEKLLQGIQLGFFSLQWPGQDPKTWRDGVSSKLPSCWLLGKMLRKMNCLFLLCDSPPIPNGKGNEVRSYFLCFKKCLLKKTRSKGKNQKISDMLALCNKNTKMV